jgi:hypothetical protein
MKNYCKCGCTQRTLIDGLFPVCTQCGKDPRTFSPVILDEVAGPDDPPSNLEALKSLRYCGESLGERFDPKLEDLSRIVREFEIVNAYHDLESRLLFSALIPIFAVGIPYGYTIEIERRAPWEIELPLEPLRIESDFKGFEFSQYVPIHVPKVSI